MSSDSPAVCGAPLPSPPPAVTRLPVGRDDVVIEQGYCLEPVAVGLTFPTSLAFDEEGRLHIAEAGYSYGPAKSAGQGRILRLERDGTMRQVAQGLRGPVTGIACRGGAIYAAEGAFPGRIARVDEDGSATPLVDGLRSGGDHFTSDIAFGPDERMYFGVGSVTNAAVVGVDNFFFGWLGSMPRLCDVPYRAIRLRGVNYLSANPFTLNQPVPCTSMTGAFKPFGVPSSPGEVIPGSLVANSVIYSARLDGSDLRVVADGLRNPFGIGFCPCGALYVLDQGYDARGSRAVSNSPDSMWRIVDGGWYGFPDFVSGRPITCPEFQTPGMPPPEFVMGEHPPLAGQPVLRLPPHSASTKFAFSTNPSFGHVGEAFIAQLGSGGPSTGGVIPAGYRVVRANLRSGEVHDFAASMDPGPGGKGPQRPVDVKFDPTGTVMYILDFGTLEGLPTGVVPYCCSGMVWKVTRIR
ncbi:MAG: hypothetical protein BWY92_00374 [Firmicutes bacterium ADurb.BinA052]|jgi:glucose/arabinose dehydrogenase|nr:MAG: hypothetical protein BWY92_00374 [Firmicutes bacterium ADurb.BinA052]